MFFARGLSCTLDSLFVARPLLAQTEHLAGLQEKHCFPSVQGEFDLLFILFLLLIILLLVLLPKVEDSSSGQDTSPFLESFPGTGSDVQVNDVRLCCSR